MKNRLLLLSAALLLLAGNLHAQSWPRVGYAGLMITNVVGATQIGGGGGGGGGAATNLAAGYFGYWNADDLSGSNNDAKLTWTDQSTNAWVLNGSAVLKTSRVNGHNSLWWGASTNGMTLNNPRGVGWPFTIQMVAKLDQIPPSVNCVAFADTNATPNMFFQYYDANKYFRWNPQGSAAPAADNSAYSHGTNWCVYTLQVNTGTTSRWYTNGVLAGTGTVSVPIVDGLRLGSYNSSLFHWEGDIACFLFYTNSISDANVSNNVVALKSYYAIP